MPLRLDFFKKYNLEHRYKRVVEPAHFLRWGIACPNKTF